MRKTDFVSNSLVIGLGEVGKAIANILNCDGIDKDEIAPESRYKFLHICIGYSEKFIEAVEFYQSFYAADYTIIHSTVPIGTSRKLHATHSPIRGVHPELEEGIRTFTKYFGGPEAMVVGRIFEMKKIPVFFCNNQEDTEALKLWDTTIYGINILIEKEIYKFCKDHGLKFSTIYTHANYTYNKGYQKLGKPQYSKYMLEHRNEEKIGGHCILPNAKLLDSPLAKLLL